MNLEKLKPGDIVLFNKKGINWGSVGIKLANFCRQGYKHRGWTHAALYIGNGEVVEAYPEPGIQRNPLSKYLQKNYSLLFVRSKNGTPEKLKKAADFCLSEQGQPYDKSALKYFIFLNFIPQQFHFILNFGNWIDRVNEDSKYFCSELVARGFEEAEMYCFERESYKIMPADFNNTLLFEEVARVDIPRENRLFAAFYGLLYVIGALVVMVLGTIITLLIIGVIVGLIALVMMLLPVRKNKIQDDSISRE